MTTERDNSVIFANVGDFFSFLAGNVCNMKRISVKSVNFENFSLMELLEKGIFLHQTAISQWLRLKNDLIKV